MKLYKLSPSEHYLTVTGLSMMLQKPYTTRLGQLAIMTLEKIEKHSIFLISM